MLELSDEPKRLVSTFKTYRNDIDIYTEDNPQDKEFYKVLFERLLDGKVKINDVTPLGNKNTVILRCKNEPENGRKKLFVVDGDINLIHGTNIPVIENLFVLKAYCVENYVVDKESVTNFIYMKCGNRSKEEIENELNFEQWLSEYSEKLIDMFVHFAIIDWLGGVFRVCNAYKFHRNGKYIADLVDSEIEVIKKEILKLTSQSDYQEKYQKLRIQWKMETNTLLSIVSGKDYLIPLVLLKTNAYKQSGALPTYSEAKFELLHYAKLDRLSDLKEIIENL